MFVRGRLRDVFLRSGRTWHFGRRRGDASVPFRGWRLGLGSLAHEWIHGLALRRCLLTWRRFRLLCLRARHSKWLDVLLWGLGLFSWGLHVPRLWRGAPFL